MKTIGLFLSTLLMLGGITTASANDNDGSLTSLINYQENTTSMVSAGQPNVEQFKTLKANGVTTVIDLLPGDRSEAQQQVTSLDLTYFNIPVFWDKPSLQNFKDYVSYMQQSATDDKITFTHCKLNWRGSAFTYLYRVTQLNEPENEAKKDMLAIWTPDPTWQAFIDEVKAYYAK